MRLFAFVAGITVAAVFALPVAGMVATGDITNTLLWILIATVAWYAAVLSTRFRARRKCEGALKRGPDEGRTHYPC